MKRKRPTQAIPKKNSPPCFYCGGPSLERDHSPHKALLGSALPPNLTTLPACRACNNLLREIEEYFNVFLAVLTGEDSLAESDNPKAMERFGRLEDEILETLEISKDGQVRVAPNPDQFRKICVKFAIGMYFRRYGLWLKPEDILSIDINPGPGHSMDLMTESFRWKRWEVIAPNIFRYIFVVSAGNRRTVTLYIQILDLLTFRIVCPWPRRKGRELPVIARRKTWWRSDFRDQYLGPLFDVEN